MLPPHGVSGGRRETPSARDGGGCSLTSLERAVLDVHRAGDVPGFRDSGAVLSFPSHRRSRSRRAACSSTTGATSCRCGADVARAVADRVKGPRRAASRGEQLALGRLYERAGDRDRAHRSLRDGRRERWRRGRAARGARAAGGVARREARYEEAARAWEDVLAPSGRDGASSLDVGGNEALAIHHEHRRRDLATARRYAEALERQASARARRDVDHRIRRIDRKLGRTKRGRDAFT